MNVDPNSITKVKPQIPIKKFRGKNAESAIFLRGSTLNTRYITGNSKILKK